MNGSNGTLPLRNGKTAEQTHRGWHSSSDSQVHTICGDGDIVLVCLWSKFQQENVTETSLSLRVSSTALKSASSYFAVLLDPAKFGEGKKVQEANEILDAKYGSRDATLRLAGSDELPQVKLEMPPLATKLNKFGMMEMFLNILMWWSDGGKRDLDEPRGFLGRLGDVQIPFLASLAVVSDRLGAMSVLNHALRASTASSKGPHTDCMSKIFRRLRAYDGENEGRIRQAIYLSLVIDDREAVRHTTHKLIIQGSKEWPLDVPPEYSAGVERALWWHLPHGIEEELCFRHQCTLNTIADLQNHFLRAYGAFPPAETKSSSRQIQCPRAYDNSHACDSFHLGEMIRFFSSRTRTIFLESSISTPDVEFDSEAECDPHPQPTPATSLTSNAQSPNLAFPQSAPTSQAPPSNVTNIISSLRQCPEYQIDPNHAGCGIRRRLIPALDCLETFTNSQSRVLGICLFHWKQGCGSWIGNRPSSSSNSPAVTISRTGTIEGAVKDSRDDGSCCNCVPRAEEARALFVSKHCRWNL